MSTIIDGGAPVEQALRIAVATRSRARSMVALVVVADDDEDLWMIVTRVMERAGHTVVAVSDGKQALSAVHAQHPALVLTDGAMPTMDGFELCRTLSQDPRTAQIPVVMISGSIDPHEARRRMPCLADAIAKPFRSAELLHRIQAVLADR